MKKIVIDTNCLLSFVTDRNPEQQEKISKLFHETGQLKVGVLCHHHVISEFVFVLSSVYGTDTEKIHEILSDLIFMPGITTVSEVNMQTVLSVACCHCRLRRCSYCCVQQRYQRDCCCHF